MKENVHDDYLQKILRTEAEIIKDGHQINNEMIGGADISVIGHFGNVVSLTVWTGCCCLIHDYNNTENLGYIIKALTELFDLTDEDGLIFFKAIKNLPVRIVSDGWGTKVIGFGHFMKDRFVYTEDLMKSCLEKVKMK